MSKLKLTFTVSEESAGGLITAAIDLKAELDSVGLVEEIPYTKNLPVMVRTNGNGSVPNYQSYYKTKKGEIKKKSNGPAMIACLKYLREQGDEGAHYEVLKDIYSGAGARNMGIFHALKAIAVKKHNNWYLKPDGKIHGKSISEIVT